MIWRVWFNNGLIIDNQQMNQLYRVINEITDELIKKIQNTNKWINDKNWS